MRNMAFIIRTTVPMMEEKYGFGKTIREQARKEYLDRRGVLESFRW